MEEPASSKGCRSTGDEAPHAASNLASRDAARSGRHQADSHTPEDAVEGSEEADEPDGEGGEEDQEEVHEDDQEEEDEAEES